MSVRVVSKPKDGVKPLAGELVIAIDRPSGSALANKHYMAHEGQRERVIKRFREDLIVDWRAGGVMRKEIERIVKLVRSGQNVALSCWCAPKRCHGHVIKQAVESLLSK